MSAVHAGDVPVEALRVPLKDHMGDIYGPPQFTNWVDESLSWKRTCYIGDWSFLPSCRFTGPDALQLFSDISVNTMDNYAIGQCKHILHCNDDGKLIAEGVLARVGEADFVDFSGSVTWAEFCMKNGDYDARCEPLDWFKYQVQGPTSLYLLERVTGESLRDSRFMRQRTVKIAGHDVIALRQGMSGELGFELQGPMEHGKDVWNTIRDAGQEFNIREMGGRVGQLNHLEACYPTGGLDYLPAIFGADMEEFRALRDGAIYEMFYKIAGSYESDDVSDWYRSPVEFGWGNRVKFDHDFPGKEALREEIANPKRMIATLVWNSDDVVDLYASLFRKGGELPDFMEMPQDPRGYMYCDKVLKNGELVGTTSSRGYSAYFRQMISLCVIDMEHREPGTEVTVIWGNPGTPQREIRATVAPAPYKQDRGRVDLTTLPATLPGTAA